jgi:hypothetical protein
MAGIKHIYRTADSFRLPTWSPLISYATNSIVAKFDSDVGEHIHYISLTQTTAGSLDSEIALTEWVRFTFDADTLRNYALEAFNTNFEAVVAQADRYGIDSDWVLRQVPTILPNPYDSDWIRRLIKREAYDSEWALARFAQVEADLQEARLTLSGADSDWVITQIGIANYNPALVTDNYDFGTITDPVGITLDLGLF